MALPHPPLIHLGNKVASPADASQNSAVSSLCVLSYNVWNDVDTWHVRRPLILDQLITMEPDVIALQEVAWVAGTASNAEKLAASLDMQVVQGGPIDEGRGLAWLVTKKFTLTGMRWSPFIEDDDGTFGTAMGLFSVGVHSDAEPDRRAMLHTTHLAHGLDASALRQHQVTRIDQIVDTWRGESELPALHVLCGDMNAESSSDEMRFLRGLCALNGTSTHWQDAWLRHHADDAGGVTWSTDSPERRTLRSCDVDRRIDYIYASTREKSGVGTILKCELAMRQRDGKTQLCGSDHLGVVARIQW